MLLFLDIYIFWFDGKICFAKMFNIILSQKQFDKLEKNHFQNGGLGISLEGTVEKVDGEEQNPHHYIRSVLPNGPVGQNGRLHSGDELLEVNGRKLLGLYHTDVVIIFIVLQFYSSYSSIRTYKCYLHKQFKFLLLIKLKPFLNLVGNLIGHRV